MLRTIQRALLTGALFIFSPHLDAHAISLTSIASDLSAPLSFVSARDGSGRSFIVEQGGLVKILRNSAVESVPFLDLSDRISTGGERGLLNIAFHPSFVSNGKVFVYYTDQSGDVVISRFAISRTNPDQVNLASERRLLRIEHSEFSNHNGGGLAFGRDGLLYIGVGDGGSAGDPNNNAQNRRNLLGKILRIDIDRGTRYSIPRSNPYARSARYKREIFAYGLRNPWRMSFDRTGTLFVGDVGQGAYEEVTVIRRGENYGWRIREGTHCYSPATDCRSAGLTAPIYEYSHSDGQSITGGYRYAGSGIPALRNKYIFGDFASGSIWSLQRVGGQWERELLLSSGRNISSFGIDSDRELYVVDYAGSVLKVVP